MDDNDNLDLLASLLEENAAAAEHISEENDINNMGAASEPDEYDKLFDEEDEESYTEEVEGDKGESIGSQENVTELFGDVGDLSEEEQEKDTVQGTSLSVAVDQAKETTNQALQDELRKLQEQMKKLQKQLEMTAIAQPVSAGPKKKTSDKSPAIFIKERKPPKLQESPCFSTQLNNSSFPNSKIQCHNPASLSGNKSHVSKPAPNLLPQPLKSVTGNRPSVGVSLKSQVSKSSSVNNHEVSLEIYSGLRLRKPRVSSVEMERKMSGRKFIRLSQLQDKLTSVNLEETDWVTFGVIIKKVTPQSSNNGKTFSIWRLNDLRDFSRCVSLFLFGDVHKDHWKTNQGMVIGLLNANLMKPKEGSDEVCVTVDHPQKILLLGEAIDLGTCKSRKKNGELCTQLVNLNECEYCQYHVQSQYRRLSSKRSDLQSTFSGNRAPKRAVKKNLGLKERICQEGFYYGGVSSAAYAASVPVTELTMLEKLHMANAAAATPKRKIQTTLSNLVVKGVDAVLQETKQRLGLAKEPLSCSEEFKELLSVPSFGARNLNKHLANASIPGSSGKQSPTFQSISASALLKQQKQQMLEARKRKSEELQRRFLQNTSRENTAVIPSSLKSSVVRSPAPGAEFPKAAKLASPQTPRLGTGVSKGDDVLFFDDLPPPAPKLNALAEAKKMAAINKLRAKGHFLSKVDPNSIKRKRSDLDNLNISERVEKNTLVSEDSDASAEPAEKKQRQQLAYLESDEFQEILNARSKHTGVLKEFEAELQERYFEPLVKKEQMEEKMRSIREVKCRVATCKTCKYTYFKLLDSCVEQNHDYLWHDGVKRFFKCPCGNRAISLDKLPKKHCSNCGLFKWERDGMLKEKKGPKIGAETLLPRGEEQARFLNSMQ